MKDMQEEILRGSLWTEKRPRKGSKQRTVKVLHVRLGNVWLQNTETARLSYPTVKSFLRTYQLVKREFRRVSQTVGDGAPCNGLDVLKPIPWFAGERVVSLRNLTGVQCYTFVGPDRDTREAAERDMRAWRAATAALRHGQEVVTAIHRLMQRHPEAREALSELLTVLESGEVYDACGVEVEDE